LRLNFIYYDSGLADGGQIEAETFKSRNDCYFWTGGTAKRISFRSTNLAYKINFVVREVVFCSTKKLQNITEKDIKRQQKSTSTKKTPCCLYLLKTTTLYRYKHIAKYLSTVPF
jgi:hypothetical protein